MKKNHLLLTFLISLAFFLGGRTELMGQTYTKVTSIDEITSGGDFIMASSKYNKILKTTSSGNSLAVAAVTISENQISSPLPENSAIFTIETSSTYFILTLKNDQTYLCGRKKDSYNQLTWLNSDDYNKWTISFDNDNVDIYRIINTEERHIVFSNYSCGLTSTSYPSSDPLTLFKAAATPSINVSPSSVELQVATSIILTANVSNVDSPTITWSSSNTEVATVSATTTNTATISGVGLGSATITASIMVGETQYTSNCTVNVTNAIIMCNGTTTIGNEAINFYDSGGSNGNYSDNENLTLTISPEDEGKMVQVAFTNFKVEDKYSLRDYLEIYDGTTTASEIKIGTYNDIPSPSSITASNISGALTFKFISNNSINKEGWVATVSSITPAALAIEDATNVTYNSAKINWTGSIPSYTVKYKKHSDNDWTTAATTSDTYYELSGLDEETVYDVSITDGFNNTFTSNEYFTTLSTPLEIAAASDITKTSATVNWTGGKANYTVQYRVNGTSEWTTAAASPVSTKSCNITGLIAGTVYDVKITDSQSNSIEEENYFTTIAQYPAPTDLTTSNIKTLGATFTWNDSYEASSYNLRYCVSSPEDWTTVNGLTETTYTIANGLTAQTEYQVQVQAVYGENISAWSTSYNFTTLPVKRYITPYGWGTGVAWNPNGVPTANHDVVIEQNALIGYTNAYANDVTINNGVSLTISANGTLTCNNITNNGTLIIEDGGQLICNNAVEVTAQKSIAKASNWGTATSYTPDAWYFIASPINSSLTPAAAGLITGDFDLYRYDATNKVSDVVKPWVNYRAHTGDFTLTNGQGYLYANAANQTLEFTGPIKPYSTSDNTVTLTRDGWNLIGNPYTFAVNVDKAFNEVNKASAPTSRTANSTINPCVGIAVYGSNGDVVTFTKPTELSSAPSSNNIQMVLAQTVATRGGENMETIDNAIVSFNEGSELPKFYFGSQNANIYIPMDNEEYAIAYSDQQGEMPVNFKAYENGQYTLTVNPENVEVGYLHLIDNIAGKEVDLIANPSYTFNARTDDYESRFRLVFSAQNDNAELGDDFAFISNGQIILNEVTENASLQVIDMMGRIVSNQQVNGNSARMTTVANGVYVLRLIEGNNVRNQKVIIK